MKVKKFLLVCLTLMTMTIGGCSFGSFKENYNNDGPKATYDGGAEIEVVVYEKGGQYFYLDQFGRLVELEKLNGVFVTKEATNERAK